MDFKQCKSAMWLLCNNIYLLNIGSYDKVWNTLRSSTTIILQCPTSLCVSYGGPCITCGNFFVLNPSFLFFFKGVGGGRGVYCYFGKLIVPLNYVMFEELVCFEQFGRMQWDNSAQLFVETNGICNYLWEIHSIKKYLW